MRISGTVRICSKFKHTKAADIDPETCFQM